MDIQQPDLFTGEITILREPHRTGQDKRSVSKPAGEGQHMIYGALRVSTTLQDVDNQKHGILAYANERGLSPIVFVEDTASGKVHWRDRKFGAMLQNCVTGDSILFAEVSRIGRSTLQVLEFLHESAERGVNVHIVKQNMLVDGSLNSEIMVTMLGLAARIEREFISQRTTEALAKRKAEGVVLGRPKGTLNETLKLDNEPGIDKIREYFAKDLSQSVIAKICGCSRSTLADYCRIRKIEIPAKRKKKNANAAHYGSSP